LLLNIVKIPKNSGYGRELSSMGIQEFMNKKLVRVASIDAST
jgi:succinate-semialdehyde dehydrogenase/glutarate-semialdehyde dehydrogenase